MLATQIAAARYINGAEVSPGPAEEVETGQIIDLEKELGAISTNKGGQVPENAVTETEHRRVIGQHFIQSSYSCDTMSLLFTLIQLISGRAYGQAQNRVTPKPLNGLTSVWAYDRVIVWRGGLQFSAS